MDQKSNFIYDIRRLCLCRMNSAVNLGVHLPPGELFDNFWIPEPGSAVIQGHHVVGRSNRYRFWDIIAANHFYHVINA